MEINWKNLITRTISGAVLVLLIVCAVVFGTVSVYSKILFGVLFSFIMVVCQKEFLNITTKENASINIFFAIIPSLFLLWGTVLDGINVIDGLNNLYTISDLFIFLYVVLLIIYFVASFFIKSEAVNFKYIIVSMIYIAIPFALYTIIELSNEESLPIGVGLFLIIWGNDTVAYLVGSMIGKHKMFPTISPKKIVGGLCRWHDRFFGNRCINISFRRKIYRYLALVCRNYITLFYFRRLVRINNQAQIRSKRFGEYYSGPWRYAR